MKRLAVFGFLFVATTLFSISCQKELSQESNLNNATFSLHDDSSKICYPVLVNGDYYNGVSAARDLNFITVIVNVKSTGNYNISSNTPNGFFFSDSGFFSRTGLDTLILKAKGTPILIQTNDYVFPSDSLGNCGFSIDVQDSTGTGLGGTTDTSGNGGGTVTNGGSADYVDPNPAADNSWHFTDSTNNKTYSGTMLPANFQSSFGLNVLSGGGTVTNNTSEVFNFIINMPTNAVTTGSYAADAVTAFLTLANVSTLAEEYNTDGSTANEATDPSYINVTSYDASTKRLKISFRCWATDANGNPALIKGSVNTTVQ